MKTKKRICFFCKKEKENTMKHIYYIKSDVQTFVCRECNNERAKKYYNKIKKDKTRMKNIYFGQLKSLAKKLGYKIIKEE